MSIELGINTFQPEVIITPSNPERLKYERLWGENSLGYREYSPGELTVNTFLNQANPVAGATILDFGCGTGREAFMLSFLGGMKVVMMDFAENCLDTEVREALTTQSGYLSFHQIDLTRPYPFKAEYGFCCDVMEHIQPELINTTLHGMLMASQHLFLEISTIEDSFGQAIDSVLHLSVHSFAWWKAKLISLGAVLHWANENKISNRASFYVSAWSDLSELVKVGSFNVDKETIESNIKSSIARNLQQCTPHNKQEISVMLLAGGPSLKNHLEEIKEKRKQGQFVITVNGAYNWCLENDIKPSAQIIVDAREHNNRFVLPIVKDCKYLLASQCHPTTFDNVPNEQTYLWHAVSETSFGDLLDDYYGSINEEWYPVPGGSTVVLRAFTLLRMLGFYRFEVFGFDSCIIDEVHHSYMQSENDGCSIINVSTPDGKIFKCNPWMASQAQEFLDQMRVFGNELEMIVNGDGLISHIIKVGATGVYQ